jgi:uncharacterized membrane protein
VLVATTNSGAYKVVLLLHIVTVIGGFGTLFFSSMYAQAAVRRRGPEGAAVVDAASDVMTRWADKFVYLVPIFGIVLILLSDDAWDFGQTWISAALILYIVILGIWHGMYQPNLRSLNALLLEADPGAHGTQLQRREARSATLGLTIDVLLVVAVVLMIWKPGA